MPAHRDPIGEPRPSGAAEDPPGRRCARARRGDRVPDRHRLRARLRSPEQEGDGSPLPDQANGPEPSARVHLPGSLRHRALRGRRERSVPRPQTHFLPGPYCFILQATREVPKLVQTKRKTIGIRIPNSEVIRAITRELGRPVISTTAQKAGGDPYVDPHEIDTDFHGLVDGPRRRRPGGMVPTTVIDLTQSPPLIVREGAGSIEQFV